MYQNAAAVLHRTDVCRTHTRLQCSIKTETSCKWKDFEQLSSNNKNKTQSMKLNRAKTSCLVGLTTTAANVTSEYGKNELQGLNRDLNRCLYVDNTLLYSRFCSAYRTLPTRGRSCENISSCCLCRVCLSDRSSASKRVVPALWLTRKLCQSCLQSGVKDVRIKRDAWYEWW